MVAVVTAALTMTMTSVVCAIVSGVPLGVIQIVLVAVLGLPSTASATADAAAPAVIGVTVRDPAAVINARAEACLSLIIVSRALRTVQHAIALARVHATGA